MLTKKDQGGSEPQNIQADKKGMRDPPQNQAEDIEFSKKKVAKVSKKGLVTAKKKGTAKITVKCGSKKKTIKVKVIQ